MSNTPLNGYTATGGQFNVPTNGYSNSAIPISNGIDGFFGNLESLTPEALMLYCQTQLNTLDGDIRAFMQNQKYINAKKKILAELKNELQRNTTVGKNGKDLDENLPKIAAAYERAYASLEQLKTTYPNVDVAGDLQAVAAHAKKMWPNGDLTTGKIGPTGHHINMEYSSAFDGWVGDLDNIIDDLSKNAELNMIQLQSIMSQRQTAIQLTQSMMDKLLKTLEQLASKVGG
jgi:hypothetical protein